MAGRFVDQWRKRVWLPLTRTASLAARLVFVETAVTELGLELGQAPGSERSGSETDGLPDLGHRFRLDESAG
jgi:hypothetical protein